MSETERKPTCGEAGGKTRAGKPCGVTMNLSDINGLCLMHDPLRRAELHAVRVAGAKARGRKIQQEKAALPADVPPKPRTLKDAIQWASWATHSVAIGAINVRVAHEIAVLVREFRMALEKRALEETIEELQAQLKAAQQRDKMRVA